MRKSSHRFHFSRTECEPYLFLAPWMIGFVLFLAFPIAFSLVLSVCRWDMISPAPDFAGIANYRRMVFHDPRFWHSLKVTTIYALGSVPLTLCFSLGVAVLLNARLRSIGIFRTIFYLPSVVSGVAVAVLWMGLLNPEFGLVNLGLGRVFGWLGVPEASLPKWLFSQRWALPSLILMSLWSIGPTVIIFLAGLQSVPTELIEAAEIDGAGPWQRFRSVTLPLLTPMVLFNLVIGIIGAFQVFTQGYVMTGGGPRDATLFFVLYIWQKAFLDFQAGYASALAWVLFAIILALTLVVLRSSRRWVHYGAEAGA